MVIKSREITSCLLIKTEKKREKKTKTTMNIRSVHSVLFGAIVLILSAYAQEDSHAELEATNKLNEVQNNDLAINGAKIVQESKFLNL